MTAEVLPFPLARREDFIRRHARYAASLREDAAERYLQRQFQHQADTMRRRGIDDLIAAAEIKSMDRAIRATLWSIILQPIGGSA